MKRLLLLFALLMTAAAAVAGPPGLPAIRPVLLNSGLGGLGPEMVTNGDFSAWTTDDPDGWTVEGAETGTVYVTESSGAARLVTDGALQTVLQDVGFVNGESYKVGITIIASAGGTVKVMRKNGSSYYPITGLEALPVGKHRVTFVCPSAGNALAIVRNSGATDVTFDNVTVKKNL